MDTYVFGQRSMVVGADWSIRVVTYLPAALGSEWIQAQTGPQLCHEPIQHRIEVFERLTTLCHECFSQDSWHDVRWIGDLWDALAGSLEDEGVNQAQRLLGLALRETARDGF